MHAQVWVHNDADTLVCTHAHVQDPKIEHTGGVQSLAHDSAGRMYSCDSEGNVCVWEKPSNCPLQCVLTVRGHAGGVCGMCFDALGRLVTSSYDGTVKVWVWRHDQIECVQVRYAPAHVYSRAS
jgi:WD40 repeat protein